MPGYDVARFLNVVAISFRRPATIRLLSDYHFGGRSSGLVVLC